MELFGKISQDVREIGKVFAAGLEGAEVAAEVALGRVVAGVPGPGHALVERFDRRGTEPFELFRSEFGPNWVKIRNVC